MKIIATLLLTALSTSAYAGAARCPAIEFAELQTYNDKELKERLNQYRETRLAILTTNMAEFNNCSDQIDRIMRLQRSRREVAEAKEAETAKATEIVKTTKPTKPAK